MVNIRESCPHTIGLVRSGRKAESCGASFPGPAGIPDWEAQEKVGRDQRLALDKAYEATQSCITLRSLHVHSDI